MNTLRATKSGIALIFGGTLATVEGGGERRGGNQRISLLFVDWLSCAG
jgi:hypothetical protein